MTPPKLYKDDLQAIETSDGSTTWRQRETGFTYRSIYGAHTESKTVFLHGTRLHTRDRTWRVLEFGFGVGTNFLTTARAAHEAGVQLLYTSVDFSPIPPSMIEGEDAYTAQARRVVNDARNTQNAGMFRDVCEETTLTLFTHDWLDAPFQELIVDAVYFDPFGPDDNPDAWTPEHFARAVVCMTDTAILATYSAAGRVRRAMFAAGLSIATAPGPGKKREISLAAKTTAALETYAVIKKYNHNLKTH